MTMPALIPVALAALLPLSPASQKDGANPQGKEPAEAPAQKIKDLKKERIATLKDLVETATAILQRPGRPGIEPDFRGATEATLLLLQAELEVAENGADRIALYKKTIARLKQYEAIAKDLVAAGRASVAAGLAVKARRLEVEIQLEQAKAREAREGK